MAAGCRLWLAAFMWHFIEKCEGAKCRLSVCGAWSLAAASLYAAIGVSGAAINGVWP